MSPKHKMKDYMEVGKEGSIVVMITKDVDFQRTVIEVTRDKMVQLNLPVKQ